MTALLVFLGAGIGGVARYAVGRGFGADSAAFPWATLTVNVSGSLLITALATIISAKGASPQMSAFLTIGLCGGYTTFSAFSAETLLMIQGGHWGRATAYALASVVLCVAAALAGMRIGVAMTPDAWRMTHNV